MTSITIIGAGNMASAIAGLAARGGASVQILARDTQKASEAAAASSATPGLIGDEIIGETVVLALPYPAIAEVMSQYVGKLDGKTIVDISNPLDFATFDGLVVPADGSAAQEIAAALPGATVLKAFNTSFAATLFSAAIGSEKTTVLVAGDDAEAKSSFAALFEAGGVSVVDLGALKRARELEAIGFAQLVLAVGEKIAWTGGFALVK